ncbi:hypothetical protein KUCAC02_006968, partial [Chaenocephalus aceratus]
VCVRKREQEREGQRKARFSLQLLLCHFWEERGGSNASSGPFLQILHLMEETDLRSARFEGKGIPLHRASTLIEMSSD